jgi:putative acetyltransferase
VNIVVDDLSGPEVAALLEEHTAEMRRISPLESKHALDLDGLRRPEITFWTVRDGDALLGCGALHELDARHGEIKSMRTSRAYARRGVASTLLRHIIDAARHRSYRHLSLETGSMSFFVPAHRLYEKHGFVACGPFAGYRDDPNSRFMTLPL